MKAVFKAIIKFENPALSAGEDGHSQSKSNPSNLYDFRKETADETNLLILVVLETSVEYFGPESDAPPTDIKNFALGFLFFKATKLAKPLREISAQGSDGLIAIVLESRTAKAYK